MLTLLLVVVLVHCIQRRRRKEILYGSTDGRKIYGTSGTDTELDASYMALSDEVEIHAARKHDKDQSGREVTSPTSNEHPEIQSRQRFQHRSVSQYSIADGLNML